MDRLFFVSLLSVAVLIGVTSGQRKISRNVPLASTEVKTTVNFDCPEEFGYYPHPDDCTQYYVCVFGGALLESCTGGLMYSHELQTCDWPRNVGCDGADVSVTSTATTAASVKEKQREESRTRYTPPPPPQPAAVVTSRGQPRQLQHNQELIKQQQLYEESEESLPPADEVENDRQQRVYRGQPSTLGQVQRDRDGLRHTNAISNYNNGRSEKIGVISFGTHQHQQPLQPYSENDLDMTNTRYIKMRSKRQIPSRVEVSTTSTPQQSTATATARNLYNTSQYKTNNNYEPYYALYEDDVELYKDVDYSHNNYNGQQQSSSPTSYRRTSANVQPTTAARDDLDPPKRGNVAFVQTNYNMQDIYQPASEEYEDNGYGQVEDSGTYRQNNRHTSRGDRNELTHLADRTTNRINALTGDSPTRKLSSNSRTATVPSTTTTFRPKSNIKNSIYPSESPQSSKENQSQAQSKQYLLPQHPEQIPHSSSPIISQVPTNEIQRRRDVSTVSTNQIVTYKPTTFENLQSTSTQISTRIILAEPSPFILSTRTTSESPSLPKPHSFERTSSKKKTISGNSGSQIIPTTYSPSRLYLKNLLTRPLSTFITSIIERQASNNSKSISASTDQDDEAETTRKYQKLLKTVRKFVNPIKINNELSYLSSGTNDESREFLESSSEDIDTETTSKTDSVSSLDNYERPSAQSNDDNYSYVLDKLNKETLRIYADRRNITDSNLNAVVVDPKRFRTTVEIPPKDAFISSPDDDKVKPDPDEFPSYKPLHLYDNSPPEQNDKTNTFTTTTTNRVLTTDKDVNSYTFLPARASRVNAALKSMIAIGATRRQPSKCNESPSITKCNDKRNGGRGRGASHYLAAGPLTNEVTVNINVNRGTAPPRSRPTLKPSTSIVSKASEFIDVYRFPPRRPDPIYPQPQPDKTAAKCRKDVCLLPDCSCGGKEIPGDLPVEQVPQMVLLTYDDSVNDLNKGLYSDLFEKGRTNPNGCPIAATFYVSHEWTDYSQVQNLYSDGHEIASHTVSHSFGEQFSQKKWTREVAGQREILAAYGGVHLEDVRGMRAPFLSVGGNKMFKMLYDSNFTYDSSMPIYENKPPSWPYTLDYKLFHDCMIPPCPTRSYPGVWEVPMVMWQDLNGGRCSMGDACSNPQDAEGVYKMIMKNFQRHYTTNRAPFGLFYHAAWFTQPHHKEGFIQFLDSILTMKDVWVITNWQAIQWVRDPTPMSRLANFQPFQCNFAGRPKRCNNPKVCNLWHKSGVRYMRTCQPCPDIYPWTGNTGIRSSKIDNDIED